MARTGGGNVTVSISSAAPTKISTAGSTNDRLTVTFPDTARTTGTIYYGTDKTVSPTNNVGSISPGGTLTMDRTQLYFIAARTADGHDASGLISYYPPVTEEVQLVPAALVRINGNTIETSVDHGATWVAQGGGAFVWVADGSGGWQIQPVVPPGGAINPDLDFSSGVFGGGLVVKPSGATGGGSSFAVGSGTVHGSDSYAFGEGQIGDGTTYPNSNNSYVIGDGLAQGANARVFGGGEVIRSGTSLHNCYVFGDGEVGDASHATDHTYVFGDGLAYGASSYVFGEGFANAAGAYVLGDCQNATAGEIGIGKNHNGAPALRVRNDSGTDKIGFFTSAPAAKPTVTGSRGGNAALASLLTALAGLGLITDSTSA